MKLLYIGDIVGEPGRKALHQGLPAVIARESIDFVAVNIENSAGGFGVTDSIMTELMKLPIDVFTSGNHIWDKKEFVEHLDRYDNIVRPANYPAGNPGVGKVIRKSKGGVTVAVVQLMGQVFMPPCDNPFHVVEKELAQIGEQTRVIFVDIHCEATSEKQAMGRHLDGRASAVLGTHTHVPTADERILPGGTAFQTDVGMSGAYDSIIGFRHEEIVQKFIYNTPRKMEVAKLDVRLCGAIVDIDEDTGRARSIERLMEKLELK